MVYKPEKEAYDKVFQMPHHVKTRIKAIECLLIKYSKEIIDK